MVPFKVPTKADSWGPTNYDNKAYDSATKILKEIRRKCGIGEEGIINFEVKHQED